MTHLVIASSNKTDLKALKLGEGKYDSFLAKVSQLNCRFTKPTYRNKLRVLRTGQCFHLLPQQHTAKYKAAFNSRCSSILYT